MIYYIVVPKEKKICLLLNDCYVEKFEYNLGTNFIQQKEIILRYLTLFLFLGLLIIMYYDFDIFVIRQESSFHQFNISYSAC